MARARNIKPGFYKNEDLAECSVWARLIFPGLWMLADRDGRLEDRPKKIKGELLPFDAQDVEPLLRELAEWKFIHRYESGGVRYIQILKFSTHQTPHYSEKKSVMPPPDLPEFRSMMAGELQESDGDIRGQDSWSAPGELQENSKKAAGLKRVSQPPDSLNPDSLIPESLQTPPLTPLAVAKGDAPANGHDLLGDTPAKRTRKRKPVTDCPDEFDLSDAMYDWANAKGITDEEVAFETERCLNHHKAKGNMHADWQATWRTWMLNVVKFRKEKRAS